ALASPDQAALEAAAVADQRIAERQAVRERFARAYRANAYARWDQVRGQVLEAKYWMAPAPADAEHIYARDGQDVYRITVWPDSRRIRDVEIGDAEYAQALARKQEADRLAAEHAKAEAQRAAAEAERRIAETVARS